ncbi:hyccin 2-like [Oncorhynchus masou masou]|uniref:hyccin 2-like n=1 Tax=Oncorhynchus masou masou TaxID=90313 RepID=UPI0031838B8A
MKEHQYNGEWEMGKEALEDILYRAQLELYSQPLLLGNAMKSSLPDNAPDETRGRKVLQVEVTPTVSRISRSAITAASIRRHRWKREDADGMSVGEESFNLNDPDEGFSSGASNSSQPSATKPGVPGPGGSQKSSSVKKTVTARLSRERERELMHREKEMEKMKDQERAREKERELERWREKERQRERVAESRRELFSAVVATPTAALRRRQQTQTPAPAPPPVTMDTIDIELSPIKKQQSFPGPCPSPSPGTLVRTASSASSKSLYEGVNMNLNGSISSLGGALGGSGGLEGALGGLGASVGGGGTHRYSTISLQEEVLARPEENQELLSSGAPLTKQSRSPSFNMQIISQV